MPQEPIELIKGVRGAIDQNEMENVFKAAGAREITGKANEVIRESSAAQIGRLLAAGKIDLPPQAVKPNPKLVDAANQAIDQTKLDAAARSADLDPEDARRLASREVARIAQAANDFARAEDRPLCHNCAAIGAARAASEIGPSMTP